MRAQLLKDFEAMLKKIFAGKAKRIKRGLEPLEGIKRSDLPMVCYNAASTTSANQTGVYDYNVLSVNLGFTVIDRETNEDEYFKLIDEYVELIQNSLDVNEQFSDGVIDVSYTIVEDINDHFMDGYIVLNVSMDVTYRENRV